MFIQGKEFENGVLVVTTNYSRSEHAGAGNCFQIVDISIENETGDEYSISEKLNIDHGCHYFNFKEFLCDLEIDITDVNYREEIVD